MAVQMVMFMMTARIAQASHDDCGDERLRSSSDDSVPLVRALDHGGLLSFAIFNGTPCMQFRGPGI